MDLTSTSMSKKIWPKTIFDTKEWVDAWARSTIERVTAYDDTEPGMYAVEWSPFWGGYEFDSKLAPLWDRPLLTIGTLYSFYGPSYLLDDPNAVASVMDRAADRARDWDTAGVLVANLPEEAALAWAQIRQPDASVRLDIAYHRELGIGADPITGDVSKHVRVDWRRRWRRATEQGLRLVDEVNPDPARIEEVIGLANDSATRHGWPAVYDRTTADEVLAIPGARLLRAEWSGQTAAGFIALEYHRTLNLWAGGTHPTLLREVSPYLFILYEMLGSGADRGLDRIEFGRGNDAFKRKYGFEGTNTWSLWYARNPVEARTYAPKLAKLNERLSEAMEVPHQVLPHPGPQSVTVRTASTSQARSGSTPRKRVLVTGGASGIGAAIVARFVADGASVAVLDCDAAAVESLRGNGPAELALAGDVGDPTAVDAAFAELDARWGGLDVVVNNAGISTRAAFLDVSLDSWNRVLAVNLTGVFLLAQRAARRMIDQGGGVIINISSVSGLVGMPSYAAYNASKAGVIGLTRTMALELAPIVRTNAVCPGYVLTPMQRSEYTETMLRDCAAKIPLGRLGQPEEIAGLVAYLASDDAAFITGQSFVIDGGEIAGGLAS